VRAGLLDRKVAIQTPSEARGAFGEVVPGWTAFATVWAQYKPQGGNEKMHMGEQSSSLTCVWRMRWMNGVNAKMRITDDQGVDWRIKTVTEGGRREWLDLLCEAPSV
jgi:SPP1 family predicted phage head-tail adaptor